LNPTKPRVPENSCVGLPTDARHSEGDYVGDSVTEVSEIGVYAIGDVHFLDFTFHTPDVSTHGALQPGDLQRDVGGDGVIESAVSSRGELFGAFLIFVSTKRLPAHEATGHW
jgi:hypothetical protein